MQISFIQTSRWGNFSKKNSFIYFLFRKNHDNDSTRDFVRTNASPPLVTAPLLPLLCTLSKKIKFSTAPSLAPARLHRAARSRTAASIVLPARVRPCLSPRCLLAAAGPLTMPTSTEPASLYDGRFSKQARRVSFAWSRPIELHNGKTPFVQTTRWHLRWKPMLRAYVLECRCFIWMLQMFHLDIRCVHFAKSSWKVTVASFRCYLAKFIQLWTN
jgi:hypothetical protein